MDEEKGKAYHVFRERLWTGAGDGGWRHMGTIYGRNVNQIKKQITDNGRVGASGLKQGQPLIIVKDVGGGRNPLLWAFRYQAPPEPVGALLPLELS